MFIVGAHHSDQDFIWREWLKVNKKIGQKSDKRKGGASKKIKKNSTSFMFFCASERAKNNLEGPPREQAKELGRRWRALHVEQREIYHKKAEEDKKRYEEEKKRFEKEEEEGRDEEMEAEEETEAQGEVEVQEERIKSHPAISAISATCATDLSFVPESQSSPLPGSVLRHLENR